MTLRIFKYDLLLRDLQHVEMPKGAQLLSVQMQKGSLCLWALVNPNAEKEKRLIEIIGTGNPFEPNSRKFISTAQMCEGSLVWHVFERTS